jgi:hypothetical protein
MFMGMKQLTFRYSFFICMAFIFLGCTKKETIEVHENRTISGNTVADSIVEDYSTITTNQVRVYINKLYIDLTGGEPSEALLEEKVQLFESDSLSFAIRDQLIDELSNDANFYSNVFTINANLMLGGSNKLAISEFIQLYEDIANNYYLSGDTVSAEYVLTEIPKLDSLLMADSLYSVGIFNLNRFFRCLAYNAIYDEVNMGSENFVVACFQNYFGRFPTNQELAQGVLMVDGGASHIFLQAGESKPDFLDIMVNDPEFYQGIVIQSFTTFLTRTPTSEEVNDLSIPLYNTGNLQALYKSIMRTDEYAGFNN